MSKIFVAEGATPPTSLAELQPKHRFPPELGDTLYLCLPDGTLQKYIAVKNTEVCTKVKSASGCVCAECCALEITWKPDPCCVSAETPPPAPFAVPITDCLMINGEPTGAFTLVDINGNPLFEPRPLTDLGFDNCEFGCDE